MAAAKSINISTDAPSCESDPMSLLVGIIRHWTTEIISTCNDFHNREYRAEFEPRVNGCVEGVIACLTRINPDDRRLVMQRMEGVLSLIDRLEFRSSSSCFDQTQPDVPGLHFAIKDQCDWLMKWWRAVQPSQLKLIPIAVAVKRFSASRSTLKEAVRTGKLKDHRAAGHGKTSPLLLDEVQVAQFFPLR